jgi:hypothetical protein
VTVSSASSDQSATAPKPVKVAVREDMWR